MTHTDRESVERLADYLVSMSVAASICSTDRARAADAAKTLRAILTRAEASEQREAALRDAAAEARKLLGHYVQKTPLEHHPVLSTVENCIARLATLGIGESE